MEGKRDGGGGGILGLVRHRGRAGELGVAGGLHGGGRGGGRPSVLFEEQLPPIPGGFGALGRRGRSRSRSGGGVRGRGRGRSRGWDADGLGGGGGGRTDRQGHLGGPAHRRRRSRVGVGVGNARGRQSRRVGGEGAEGVGQDGGLGGGFSQHRTSHAVAPRWCGRLRPAELPLQLRLCPWPWFGRRFRLRVRSLFGRPVCPPFRLCLCFRFRLFLNRCFGVRVRLRFRVRSDFGVGLKLCFRLCFGFGLGLSLRFFLCLRLGVRLHLRVRSGLCLCFCLCFCSCFGLRISFRLSFSLGLGPFLRLVYDFLSRRCR
mmetsp:Transcript_10932/g.19139  ORF Transcript_10932/g.19139 Transcript_10932/m.19139 type:complete len:315 (-) Transcript_10932:540-1484(-)